MIKICVYVTDVDDETGPFETVEPAASKVLGDPDRFEYPIRSHEQAEAMLAMGAAFYTSHVGPAGTVIFADTARYYHRGKPPIRSDRAAIFYGYFARPPRHPFLCERSRLSRSQIAQLVADLPQAEREMALWTRSVPIPIRWIPKNIIQV